MASVPLPQQENSCITKNQAAFATITTLAVATTAAAVAAATTASTVAIVAYSILAITLGGASIAAITAWLDPETKDLESYFSTMKDHAAIAIAGFSQLMAQVAVQSVIAGIGDAIQTGIARALRGDDQTITVRHQ